ncbi:MAG TPA: hypothetical protein VGH50_00210 [Candidatus Binatia bacterium]|jgi:hypothetical protein
MTYRGAPSWPPEWVASGDFSFGQKVSRLLRRHLHCPLEVIGAIEVHDRLE